MNKSEREMYERIYKKANRACASARYRSKVVRELRVIPKQDFPAWATDAGFSSKAKFNIRPAYVAVIRVSLGKGCGDVLMYEPNRDAELAVVALLERIRLCATYPRRYSKTIREVTARFRYYYDSRWNHGKGNAGECRP